MDAERARLERLYPFNRHDPLDEEVPAGTDDEAAIIILKDRAERVKNNRMTEQLAVALASQPKVFKPPIFSGKKEEKADAHLLLVEDWFSRSRTPPDKKAEKFNETLESNARVWYSELNKANITWDKVKNEFIREFGKEGKTIRQLKKEWASFRFKPEEMNIKAFIRDVKTTGDLLNASEMEKLDTLRDALPNDVYAAAFTAPDLATLERLLIEMYTSRRPPGSAASTSESPFMRLTENPVPSIPHKSDHSETTASALTYFAFEITPSGETKITPVTHSTAAPFKPHIAPRGRGRGGRPNDRFNARPPAGHGRPRWQERNPSRPGWNQAYSRKPRSNYASQNPRYHSNRGRSQNPRYHPQHTQRFTGAKPRPVPRIRDSERSRNDDWNRCHYCKETGHWAKDCPQKRRPQGQPQSSQNNSSKPVPRDALNQLTDYLGSLQVEPDNQTQEN